MPVIQLISIFCRRNLLKNLHVVQGTLGGKKSVLSRSIAWSESDYSSTNTGTFIGNLQWQMQEEIPFCLIHDSFKMHLVVQ